MKYWYVAFGLSEGLVDILWFMERVEAGRRIVSAQTRHEYRVVTCGEPIKESEVEKAIWKGDCNLFVERVGS